MRTLSDSVVSSKCEVSIPVPDEERRKVSAAVQLIEKYKAAAFKALGEDPTDADWCEVSVSARRGQVTISIRKGMAG